MPVNPLIGGIIPVLLTMSLVSCGGDRKKQAPDKGDEGDHQKTECGQRFPNAPNLLSSWNGPRLPLMSVDTFSNPIPNPHKIRASLKIHEFDNNGQLIDFDSHEAGIEIRGSFSSSFPKKSYGLELREYLTDHHHDDHHDNDDEHHDHHHEDHDDDENEVDPHGHRSKDTHASLLGMPEEGDWVLYGPHVDKTLMRNMLMYDLSNEIGRYAPRGRFLDLEVNGQLQGTYSLFEKIKRDEHRVDIAKLKNDDNHGRQLTGGYIIKIDKIKPEPGQTITDLSFPSYYRSESNKIHRFSYDYPKPEDITSEQKSYIKDYIRGFEDALISDDFKDETIGYRAFINVDSFVDYFLLTELSHNVDGYRISTFLVKNKNQKLTMGPIWDYNFALGNTKDEVCNGSVWSNWMYKYNSYCPDNPYPVPFWWERLLLDDYFLKKLDARWKQLRQTVLSNQNILSKINEYTKTLQDSGSAQQNFAIWDTLNCYLWPNRFVGDSFESEVEYLKDWTIKRANWMDDNINKFVAD